MDYSGQSRTNLIALCKSANMKGYSQKTKLQLIEILNAKNTIVTSPLQSLKQEEPTTPDTLDYHLEKEKPYLKTFLEANKTLKGFKRVISSPLRYAGGKSKAIGIILDHLPALKTKKIVSPFFGGGSFELALSTHLGFEVIGYDVFGMLTNFWNQIITNPNELAMALTPLKASKADYTRNRHILLNYWEKIKPSDLHYETKNRLALTDAEKVLLDDSPLLQAAYYYYNMQLSYGPMFLGWPSSVYMKEHTYKEIIQRVKAFKPGNVKVSSSSFENAIVNHPDDFLFLDPPYYLGEDSKMFKGMYPNCNFAIHHNSFNHKLLAELLKKHKGGFFVTYNDCPTIRELYADYKQVFPSWKYTYGQGEKRIGKNRKTGTQNNVKESHEIFIICPPSST